MIETYEKADRYGKSVEQITTLSHGGSVRVSMHERPRDADPTLTAIIPGFTGDPHVYSGVRETVFNEGRNTVVFDYPNETPDVALNKEEKLRAEKLPPELRRKALSLLTALEYGQSAEHSFGKKSDVIAHSEGFVVAVMAASIRPEAFRDIVGVGPIGLSEDESMTRLFAGFLGQNLEKPQMGDGPTDIPALAQEYVQEHKDSLREAWQQTDGRFDDSTKSFEKYLETYAGMLASNWEARKQELEDEYGIQEFAVTAEDHARAALQRKISDKAFFKYVKSRPRQFAKEAKELPSVRLGELIRGLSDEPYNIGFAAVIGTQDSVAHTGRKDLRILEDIQKIKKAKPSIRVRYDALGKPKLVSVFDRAIRAFLVPGGHQGFVGYPSITREAVGRLRLLNSERI